MVFKKRVKQTLVMGLVTVALSTNGNCMAFAMNNELGDKTINMEESIDKDILLTQYNMSENDLSKSIEERNNFTEETTDVERFSTEQINLSKIEFQEKYGNEDRFIFVEEYENIKSEVNPAQGIIRLTDLETGEIDTINYFHNLDELRDNAIELERLERATPSRPSSYKTQGPDKANLSVTKGSTRDSIKAYNPVTGASKSYSKPTAEWYTGHTKAYYDQVKSARSDWSTAKSKAGSSANNALYAVTLNYVNGKDWNPLSSKFISALRAAAAGGTIMDAIGATDYAIRYLGHVGLIFTNYLQL